MPENNTHISNSSKSNEINKPIEDISGSAAWPTVNTSTTDNVRNLEIQKGNTEYWYSRSEKKS